MAWPAGTRPPASPNAVLESGCIAREGTPLPPRVYSARPSALWRRPEPAGPIRFLGRRTGVRHGPAAWAPAGGRLRPRAPASHVSTPLDPFHRFDDPDLGLLALTHSSSGTADARGRKDNERLEFLGDTVLDLVIAEALFGDRDGHPEGALTEMKAQVVSRQALAGAAQRMGLADHARLGRGLDRRGPLALDPRQPVRGRGRRDLPGRRHRGGAALRPRDPRPGAERRPPAPGHAQAQAALSGGLPAALRRTADLRAAPATRGDDNARAFLVAAPRAAKGSPAPGAGP